MKTNRTCPYICLITLIVLILVGCQQTFSIPHHLIGVWKTSSPRFEDRYLKITEDMLIFGVGNGNEISHYIQKIKIKQENNQTLYTFHYKDAEDEKWTLIFTYNPDLGGSITLKNRSETWKKFESGET
jgi:hypothetical protein